MSAPDISQPFRYCQIIPDHHGSNGTHDQTSKPHVRQKIALAARACLNREQKVRYTQGWFAGREGAVKEVCVRERPLVPLPTDVSIGLEYMAEDVVSFQGPGCRYSRRRA